jgi:hypothetical protein
VILAAQAETAGMPEAILYKALDEDGCTPFGRRDRWSLPEGAAPGRWRRRIPELVPGARGYQLYRLDQLVDWLAPVLWEAEARGTIVEAADEVVVESARLLRRVETWTPAAARHFAADCAEHVLPLWEQVYPDDDRPRRAIAAARAMAADQVTWIEAGNAGHSASEAASGVASAAAAARAAANAAAYATLYPTTPSTAAYTAADAAADAVMHAATAAGEAPDAAAQARQTERAWQTARLSAYLHGDLPA